MVGQFIIFLCLAMRIDVKGLGEKGKDITQFEYSYNYFKTSECKNKDRTVSIKFICTLATPNGNVTCSDPTAETFMDKPVLDGVFITDDDEMHYDELEFKRQSDDGCTTMIPTDSTIFSNMHLIIVIAIMFIVMIIMLILIIFLIIKLTKKNKKELPKATPKMTLFYLCYKQTL